MNINLTPPPDRYKNNEGQKIKLPEDDAGVTKTLLEHKLAEYKTRKQDQDMLYRITILTQLIDEGEIKVNEVLQKLGTNVDKEIFDNAIGVIEDYIKTGGKNTKGGTGLKKEADLVEGLGLSAEEAKQTALKKFPKDETASMRGRVLIEKLLLEGLTGEEETELKAIKAAIEKFPDNHLGQHLIITQAQGMITPEDKERLKIIEEFPKATLADIVSIIDLRKKAILPGLNKAEQEKLDKIIGKLK